MQDVLGTLGPDEWFWIFVVVNDVLIDGCSQFWDAGENATAQSLGRNVTKESLNHVQP